MMRMGVGVAVGTVSGLRVCLLAMVTIFVMWFLGLVVSVWASVVFSSALLGLLFSGTWCSLALGSVVIEVVSVLVVLWVRLLWLGSARSVSVLLTRTMTLSSV